MAACTFFGHSDCYRLDEDMLQRTIEDLIARGVDTFYVGNHGSFDSAVFSCLGKLKNIYPHITFAVVLAYLPIQKSEYDPYHGYSMYPEIEEGPQRFAIERRNKWMIQASDWCVVQIDRTVGGAYKFARMAKRRGLSDRIAIMKDGKLLICDTADKIKERAGADNFEQAFIHIVKGVAK